MIVDPDDSATRYDHGLSASLDATDTTHPFDQIRSRVVGMVNSKQLAAGDRLPTVRQLAQDLGVAVNTVARAYRELEQAGVIETRGRAGTFVTGAGVDREARAAAASYVARMRELGLSSGEAIALVERLMK